MAGSDRAIRSFDAIDMGLMVWAAVFCFVLGAAVLFAVSEALTGPALEQAADEEGAGSGGASQAEAI